MGWATLWAIFSKTHLVTLVVDRVTGWVCEKIAQIVAQRTFCPNQNMYDLFRGRKYIIQKFELLLYFKKLTQVTIAQLCKKSPNLVTLAGVVVSSVYFKKLSKYFRFKTLKKNLIRCWITQIWGCT